MATYTTLTRAETDRLLARYDLGETRRVSPMPGGQANSSFRIETDRGTFILSVCDEKEMEEVRTLTRVMAWLRDHGFPTTRPVATRSGKPVIQHDGKPVYVKAFIPGDLVRDLTRDMIREIGDAMARLHAVPPPPGLAGRFPYGMEAFETRPSLPHPFIGWLADKKRFLDASLDVSMDKGLIHGDIFWDNLVFQNGRLAAILDFEEACLFFPLFDLGMAAVGCCSANGRFDAEKIMALLDGYQRRRPLDQAEKQQFPVFLTYAATAGAFWRFRQYNVRFPLPEKMESYQELAGLADQAPGLRLLF